MPSTRIFDTIVVGNEPAGLMAAGLLRRDKHDVMFVGQGGKHDLYQHDDITLNTYPWTLPGYGQAPALDELLSELGVQDPVHRLAADEDWHLQVITPDQRLDLFPDQNELKKELARACSDQLESFFPALDGLERQADQLQAFLAQNPPLPPFGFRQRSRFKKIERTTAQDDRVLDTSRWPWLLKALLRATTFCSHLDVDQRSSAVSAHLTLSLLREHRIVPDLGRRLVQAVEKAGVVTEMATVAEHFVFEGRKVSGIQALRTSKKYTGAAILAALPMADAIELIPLKKRRQRNKLASHVLSPSNSVFIVNILIPSDKLPLGLGNNVLLIRDPGSDLTEDNLIRLLCLPVHDHPELTQVCLSCIVPYRKRRLGREYLGPLHEKMQKAAAWLIPFLEENQQSQSSPFWSSRAADSGHPAPWTIHRTIQPENEIIAGMALLTAQTKLNNLFLCGPEVVPGLGLEGQAITARQTVNWLSENKKLGKVI